jgi:hypothetical protein
MSDHHPAIENPLELAEAQLREICERHEEFETPIDTASLGRMIVHISNINRSVSTSTRDHVNAAKRLTDFAMTLDRIVKQAPPSDDGLATRINSLAETLKVTGAELAGATTIPRWAQSPPA